MTTADRGIGANYILGEAKLYSSSYRRILRKNIKKKSPENYILFSFTWLFGGWRGHLPTSQLPCLRPCKHGLVLIYILNINSSIYCLDH